MKKLRLALFALSLATSIAAEDAEYAIEVFDPPILITQEGYVGGDPDRKWAQSFKAGYAWMSMNYSEWKKYWSKNFIQDNEYDKHKFESNKAKAQNLDLEISSILAEVEYTKDGRQYIQLIYTFSKLTKSPKSSSDVPYAFAYDFSVLSDGLWINWTCPHDYPCEETQKFKIDYEIVLGFDKN